MMSKFQAYSYKTFMLFDDDLIRRISCGELCYRYLTVLHIMMPNEAERIRVYQEKMSAFESGRDSH